MTGRVVERDAQPTCRSAAVRPIGVSPLMPLHSQGAEQRKEHRAGRAGSRWGLRALVIGGLAGAAWLLTGATAHAADRDPVGEGFSLGPSLIGSVVDGSVVDGDDHGAPVVSRILKAAAEPLAPDRHRDHGSVVALPDSAVGGVDGVVRELTAPQRPAGAAVDTRKLVPATDPREAEPPPADPAPVVPVRHSTTRVTDAGTTLADQVGEVTDRVGKAPAIERHDAEEPTVSPD